VAFAFVFAGFALAIKADITVDNFEAAPFNISDILADDLSVSNFQTGIPDILGGTRKSILQTNVPGNVSASLSLQSVDNGVSVTKVRNGDPVPVDFDAVISFEYGAPRLRLNTDLTGGGQYDRFRISFSDLSAPIWLAVALGENGVGITQNQNPLIVTGPGSYDLPFSDFAFATRLNLIHVDGIWLGLGFSDTPASASFVLTDFRVVPEPAAMLLLGAGS